MRARFRVSHLQGGTWLPRGRPVVMFETALGIQDICTGWKI